MSLKKYIRDIQGFPKEGILFKDITPLLIDPIARNKTLEILVSSLKDKKNRQGNRSRESWLFLWNADCTGIECGFYSSSKT